MFRNKKTWEMFSINVDLKLYKAVVKVTGEINVELLYVPTNTLVVFNSIFVHTIAEKIQPLWTRCRDGAG